jgi:Protein of unknown function (DUF2530)
VSQSGPGGPGERRPAPPPKEADDRQVTVVITVGWLVALIVLLCVRSALPGDVRWWIWTCVTGTVMGLFGLCYVPFLKRRRSRAAARHEHPAEVQLAESSPSASASASRDGSSRDRGSNTVSSTETPGKSTMS